MNGKGRARYLVPYVLKMSKSEVRSSCALFFLRGSSTRLNAVSFLTGGEDDRKCGSAGQGFRSEFRGILMMAALTLNEHSRVTAAHLRYAVALRQTR